MGFFTESRRMVNLAGRGMRAYFAERKRMVILLLEEKGYLAGRRRIVYLAGRKRIAYFAGRERVVYFARRRRIVYFAAR